MAAQVSLQKTIGKGYFDFWTTKKRYRVVKGGRGSKKSCTVALWYIYMMMRLQDSNLLVVRKVHRTNKDSTFAQLRWAISMFGVGHLWKATTSPLELVYIPTGQKILFRGLDEPEKITSITVEIGYLCWCWFEEAFQISSEEAFNKIDLSIRGQIPTHLFKQITLSFNPWLETHWMKKRFFDNTDDNTLAITTNYLCNEFLDADDIKVFDEMKIKSPKRYAVEGLGDWGVARGLIFDNWQELLFDINEIRKRNNITARYGLDFGFTPDPAAFIALFVDKTNKEIYIFDEIYETKLLNDDLANMIVDKGYGKQIITADCAAPKDIADIKRYGVWKIKAAEKGKDSIINGIKHIHQYKVCVHPTCIHTLHELGSYRWKEDNKTGELLGVPEDANNHLIDALRYSLEDIKKSSWRDYIK